MWPAIIRTVRLGAPGTVAPHSSWGKFSKRKAVTRLLVLHASSSMSRWSSADCITTLHGVIRLTPKVRVDRARLKNKDEGGRMKYEIRLFLHPLSLVLHPLLSRSGPTI